MRIVATGLMAIGLAILTMAASAEAQCPPDDNCSGRGFCEDDFCVCDEGSFGDNCEFVDEPERVCGDVNNDSSVKTSDALLVLKKSVGQSVTLDCSAYDERFSECQSSLEYYEDLSSNSCNSIPPANAALLACNGSLAGCNVNLAPCAADLSSTNADLVFCAGELSSCDGELQSCKSNLSSTQAEMARCLTAPFGQVHKTGQTTCYSGELGIQVDCSAVPGQDGHLQKGIAKSFTDNGDGTITDNRTGLMWEKQDDNNTGGIHDRDNVYSWSTVVSAKIATLNSTAFAGHNDWRWPNRNELMTLLNMGAVAPATYPEFNTACTPGCTVTTCSCSASAYWSSTAYQQDPYFGWWVIFYDGKVVQDFKTSANNVRAVRAGS